MPKAHQPASTPSDIASLHPDFFIKAFEGSHEHMVFTDLEGKIIFANKSVERTTGYKQSEIIGQTPRLWGGLMTKEFYADMWKTIKQEKKIFVGTVKNRRKNGQEYYADVSITPILGPHGQPEYYLGIERDITHRLEAEYQIKAQRDAARDALNQLKDLSHQLLVAEHTAGLGSWELDIRTGHMNWSDELFRLLDVSKRHTETTLKNIEKAICPSDTPTFHAAMNKIQKNKRPFKIEISLNRKGRAFWVLAEASYVPASKLSTAKIVGSFLNVDRQKNYELQLLEQKSQTEAMLESIADGVVVIDNDAKIVVMNRAAENIYQLKAQNIIGKSYLQAWSFKTPEGNPLEPNDRPLHKVLSTNQPIMASQYILKGKHKDTPVSISAAPVILNDKHFGAIQIVRDITQESAIDRAKSEFVSLASHQLRTPLSSINWYSELLLASDVGELNDKQREFVNQIYSSSRRMVDLVRSLLNVSRIELGTLGYEPVAVDLNDLVKPLIDAEQHSVKAAKVKIHFKQRVKQTIQTDTRLMTIIFQNLISNAAKYSKPGGEIWVETSLLESSPQHTQSMRNVTWKGKALFIRVKDCGIGIPRAEQSKIFTKMFRAENAQIKSSDGNGLGLYLVRSVVQNLGGNIWFQSSRRTGTTFEVIIPLKRLKAKVVGAKLLDV